MSVSPPKPKPPQEDVDSLTLEVQELLDRVTVLEEGHAHMLEIQWSILQKQDEILARFVKLEKIQSYHLHHVYSFYDEQDYSLELSQGFIQDFRQAGANTVIVKLRGARTIL